MLGGILNLWLANASYIGISQCVEPFGYRKCDVISGESDRDTGVGSAQR